MLSSEDYTGRKSWLFALQRVNRVGWFLPLVALSGCGPHAVTYPQPGMAIWNPDGGGSLEGHATLRSGPTGYRRTCAGFDAYIVPVTFETTSYVRQHFGRLRDGYAPSVSVQDALGRFVTNNGGGRVPCRQDGTFIFADVAPGEYYVLADIQWLLRWAHEGGTVSTVAEVSTAHPNRIAIDVWLNSRGGTSNVR